MPHIAISMYKGRTDEQKKALAAEIQKCVCDTLGVGAEVVSVSLCDVEPEDWGEHIGSIPAAEMIIFPAK